MRKYRKPIIMQKPVSAPSSGEVIALFSVPVGGFVLFIVAVFVL